MKILVRTRRYAISELMSALILIAITLIAGAALSGWVNGQIGTSSAQIGQAVAGNINYLKENQVTVAVNFENPVSGCPPVCATTVDVWIYNRGQVALSLNSFLITSVSTPGSGNPKTIQYIDCPTRGVACVCGTAPTSCAILTVGSNTCKISPVPTSGPGSAVRFNQGDIYTNPVGPNTLQEYKLTIPGCISSITFAGSGLSPPTFTYNFQAIGFYGSTSSMTQNN